MSPRSDFLATWLVPIDLPPPTEEDEEGIDCPICLESLTTAFQLPCHSLHVFHDECIRTWLKSHNSCPLCKSILFGSGAPSSTVRNANLARQTVVDLEGNLEYFSIAPMRRPAIAANADMAAVFLVTIREPRTDGTQVIGQIGLLANEQAITGLGLVRAAEQIPQVIVMANVIFARAMAQGRSYTDEQWQRWIPPVKHILNRIRQNDGKVMNVGTFPHSLDRECSEDLDRIYPGAGRVQGVRAGEIEAGLVREDFQTLMNYAAFLMWWAVNRPLIRRRYGHGRRLRCVVM
ncbi:hypothetical protein TI39_contig5817g00022 [Zymoseptoria brevis]|uniref:RING-type domain-containing protein n=1 Tax=Zymoseptoria brevis TaxID=1047168 RepID=A0A0F4G759_9PEZI|nr:hypothetical protein TI39_contig5817g00022 [Zymoseptoria brevis]